MKDKKEEVRRMLLNYYGKIASGHRKGCCNEVLSCCGGPQKNDEVFGKLGYSPDVFERVPREANLGLGCGNPLRSACLKRGETVLDLGCGAGFDCLIAAGEVGEEGLVIGVDMTPEMIARARENAEKAGCRNVDFRLGDIEKLPVADESVDVVISNCVINLSPEKERVFREAFRVLKPGGRLAISDILALKELPQEIKRNPDLYAGCISGAVTAEEIERILRKVGFVDISIEPVPGSSSFIRDWAPGVGVDDHVTSALIIARKRV
ncbi:arsenite methyltransferase [Thermodesulforhabdus norvegica]|uniref:Arsenite methyltransferase n=1 Tax=Thermodesulforhabdus norvegica TaxID=39841 RepID=A0A1I4TNN0_9BACT|nr:arsenite methyltransferase [Thermodesulforhabdus norvegica]SFM78235.1 Ubiquinone/menaquinone biosynthesis C-methylase UbiE [Thermodesulforhabdus norvegica]